MVASFFRDSICQTSNLPYTLANLFISIYLIKGWLLFMGGKCQPTVFLPINLHIVIIVNKWNPREIIIVNIWITTNNKLHWVTAVTDTENAVKLVNLIPYIYDSCILYCYTYICRNIFRNARWLLYSYYRQLPLK